MTGTADPSATPWDAGRQLVATLATHGRTAWIETHSEGAYVVLPGHDGQFVTVSGSTADDENLLAYPTNDHHGWTAVLRDADGTQTRVLSQEQDARSRDFAEDTARLAADILPHTLEAQAA
ncbi:hypothetical protein ABZ605_38085 [Streptomyces sp. NPDC012765]|uniref:hypothetical protein n=1 Tax=Streptomyces sp. NPDC012765 TaxID=3155249 RepID=UPI0033C55001